MRFRRFSRSKLYFILFFFALLSLFPTVGKRKRRDKETQGERENGKEKVYKEGKTGEGKDCRDEPFVVIITQRFVVLREEGRGNWRGRGRGRGKAKAKEVQKNGRRKERAGS